MAIACNFFDPLDQMIDLGRRPVELNDQECLDIERVTGVHELLNCRDRWPVHDFHATRNYSRADDARNAFAGIFRRRETHEQRARRFRPLQDAHRHFRHHAEQPFRAGDQAKKIVSRCVEMLAADVQHFAGYEHDLASEQVVCRHAVFEAMHAAGILRHVAADRAGDLRGWIRRVVKAGIRDGVGDGKIGDARLDDGDAIVEVDFADPVELGHAEQYAVAKRKRATRQ